MKGSHDPNQRATLRARMRHSSVVALAPLVWNSSLTPAPHERTNAGALPGNVVDVVARDFFFQAPDTIPAGLTTLRLRVEQGGHIAVLVRLDSGHTVADLLRARREGHPRPGWAHFIGGPGFPPSGGTANATMTLTPGYYVLICDVRDTSGMRHFEKGMFHALVVRPRAATARSASPPRADVIATMRDYSFDFSAPIHSGERTLRVVNGGSVMHEFRVVHVLPGHTGRESLAWKPGDKTPRPDEDVTAIVGLVPGAELTTTVPFVAGEYVVLCVPQIAHGMIQVVRVAS
jgi:plastocyanin